MAIKKYYLENDQVKIEFLDWGAHIHKIYTKDKEGNFENILISLDDKYLGDERIENKAHFGASIGRVAGRLGKLDYPFAKLEDSYKGVNMHSGEDGWFCKYWEADQGENFIDFTLVDNSPQYEGELKVKVRYQLDGNQLIMTFFGSTTVETFFNPTNHTYWNLSGDLKDENIRNHKLYIDADHFLDVDLKKVPTGKKIPVEDTPTDFRKPKTIKNTLDQLKTGIDDTYTLNNPDLTHTSLVLSHEESGRSLSINTEREGFVIFTDTGFVDDFTVNDGHKMHEEIGLAIEAQEYPDAPNHENFGNIKLEPFETMVKKTIYTFDTK